MTDGASSGFSASEQVPNPVEGVVEGKLHPPAVRAEWIGRPRLLRQVTRAMERRVLLITAPAGYGKSTLLTQWAATPEAGPVAWVRLDAGDNDPTRLWAHVVVALVGVGCPVDVGVGAGNSDAFLTVVLPRIAEALAAYPGPLTVVLDDLQTVRSRECRHQLDEMIARLPDQVHLVVISRADPPLRLGRLRAAGEVAEIRGNDLAFTAGEVAAVLQATHVTLSETALGELVKVTEGWPAAVYLAALSLIDRAASDEFVHALTRSNRFIADYLSEEVLARQDPELHDFIVEMSLFDRFTAGLADHVRQTRFSAGMLRELERTNLFLISLQDDGWVRFHPLFASFARSALEVERPEALTGLHRRGADWFTAHGQVEDAVHHLMAGRAYQEAADLVQANWLRFFDAGRSATVQAWLTELRGTPADTGPALTVTAAWVAALTGNRVELRRRMRMLESMVDDLRLPDGTTSPRSALVLVRAMFGFDGPDQMLADAHRAVDLEAHSDTPWSAVARAALGYAGYLTGDVALARRHLGDAARGPAAPAMIRVLAVGTLALCEAEQGNATLSTRLAGEAMELVTEHALQAMPQATFAFTAYGVSLTVQNRLTEAQAVLQDGLDVRRRNPGLSPWPLVHHLLALAVVAARSGDDTTAEELLSEVDNLTSWTEESMAPTRNRVAAVRNLLDRPLRRNPPTVGESLTTREQQILRRLHGTQTLNEIATDLYVSRNTVKTITLSLYRKLGADSRAEAIDIARRLTQDRPPAPSG